DPWTSVEPAVDLNHVEWCKDSGMLLTANEGRQQHSFFIPQLGPAPKWCSFLDNLVEEMAEDAQDPSAYNAGAQETGAVYDNYKFLSTQQLRELNLDHLVGTTSLLRPYMHGYFVAQKLYEQARLISNPDMFEEQRAKSIAEKINKERESRIRGNKAAKVKVNRRLAEKMAAREEANERRKARRVLRQGGDEPQPQADGEEEEEDADKPARGVLGDDRFASLFQDEDFEIDEQSREFQLHNPSTVPVAKDTQSKRGLTAVEEEANQSIHGSSDDDSESDLDDAAAERQQRGVQRRNDRGDDNTVDKNRISSTNYRKSGHKPKQPQMSVSSSQPKNKNANANRRDRSFGSLAQNLRDQPKSSIRSGGVVGEKEVTFAPQKVQKRPQRPRESYGGDIDDGNGRKVPRGKERRSASGNVFRGIKRRSKTYSSRDSHVVTHRSTNLPFNCLCMAERTGCPVFS
ncbi:WD40 repeat-like protein, partial [Aureobasidium melanogenum]